MSSSVLKKNKRLNFKENCNNFSENVEVLIKRKAVFIKICIQKSPPTRGGT